jgi:hypothetical protein
LCGCGSKTKYLDIGRGYSKYLKGHSIRLKNPNSLRTEQTWKQIGETRKRKIQQGETKIWNKDLTKETDERVALNGKKSQDTINNNPDEIECRSKRMKENRDNGTIPTLRGENHSQWNGGTSSL